MEKLLEFLISKLYRKYREELYKDTNYFLQENFIQAVDNSQVWLDALDATLNHPIIRFGGFEFSHDWYGFTKHNVGFRLGEWKLYEHIIYLNRHFLQNMMGYHTEENEDFGFTNFLKAIADEVAHCLIFDLYPQESGHSPKQKAIAKELEKYLLNDKVIKLLKKYWK